MAEGDFVSDGMTPMGPLVGGAELREAAESMVSASRAMLAAAEALTPGLGGSDTRARELTADAIEAGFLRALRRDSLLGGPEQATGSSSLFGLPVGRGIPGTGYGRMGASVTGQGERAQLYGTIGGAIGYAVGGPVGAFLGGMVGGLLGGDDGGEAERARQQEQLARQWLNSPEGFEEQAYLYNLTTGAGNQMAGKLKPAPFTFGGNGGLLPIPVVVTLSPGAVQIRGSDTEAGERAARAFAGELGRVLRLNSVVVPAAGFGEG